MLIIFIDINGQDGTKDFFSHGFIQGIGCDNHCWCNKVALLIRIYKEMTANILHTCTTTNNLAFAALLGTINKSSYLFE